MALLNQHDVNEIVFQFLVQNHFHFKEKTAPFRKQKEALLTKEDSSFHEEINQQYRDLVKQMVLDEITKQFALPIESVIITLEGFNVDAYV